MNKPFIVASRGRNPDNPSDRTKGIKTEQRLEPNKQGLCNTLTSVQKDNYVVEPPPCTAIDEQNNRLRTDGTVGTIMTDGSSPKHNNRVIDAQARIRKLTPRECWRLMGFSDEDFEKAAYYTAEEIKALDLRSRKKYKDLPLDAKIERVSNTQLYHQAGNSIVVFMLMAVFWELLL